MNDGRPAARGILFGLPVSLLLWALILFALFGCAEIVPQAPPDLALGPHPYVVGPLRVFVMAQRDVEAVCRANGQMRARHGCFIAEGRSGGFIVTIAPQPDDRAFWVQLHEWKHVFEGAFHP